MLKEKLVMLILLFFGLSGCQAVQELGTSSASADAPVVVLTEPSDGQVMSGSVVVAGSILEQDQVTAFFLYHVSGTQTNVVALPWSGPGVQSFRTEITPQNGECKIWVEASDGNGNMGYSEVVTVTITNGSSSSSVSSSTSSDVSSSTSDSSSVSSAQSSASSVYSSQGSSTSSSSSASSASSGSSASSSFSSSSSSFSSSFSSSSSSSSSSSAFSGIRIYVEKPSAWSNIWIWYDEGSDDVWETSVLATSPGDMTEYRSGWFKKELSGSSSVTFLFNDGTWNNTIKNAGANFVTTEDVWILSDGTATNVDPLGDPDTQNPTVTLTAPTSGQTVSGNVSLSATASDDVGVVKVELFVDDALVGSVTSAPYTYDWDSLSVSGGSHVLKATAYDAAGNNSSATVSVTVDNSGIAPSVAASPAGGDFYSDGVTTTLSVTGEGVTASRYTTDGSDPASGGTTFTNGQSITIGSGLTNGQSVTLKLYALNSAGSGTQTYVFNRKEHSADPEKPYSLNPTYGKYRSSGIVIDGANTAGEWTSDMLVAIDMANDDPRSLGDNWTMHEAPIDYSHLWACWDDSYLYIAWQVVDVTDAIDPSNAGSGDVVFGNDGILQSIVLDTDPTTGATLDMWGKNNGEPYWGGSDLPDVQIYIASSLWQGYVSRAVNGTFPVDDGGTNYFSLADANIDVEVGAGFYGPSLWGVLDADDALAYPDPITPVDMLNTGKNGDTHQNTSRDGFYEMKIPLTFLGLTRSDLETKGIGVMVIGQGAMDTIPHDPASIDLPGVETYNSSFEWSDTDLLTSDFARIGHSK